MKYGLIGEKLSHSFSKDVHGMIADYSYELKEIEKDALDGFMKEKDFKAINVTIPYKEAVIPYIDFISDEARAIGAVNTIVNKDGKLYGYNTDFFGMSALINKTKLDLKGKKVAILGTGGTSKTAYAVSKSLGASTILKVSRSEKNDAITYDELLRDHTDIDVLINTTPIGMYPDNLSSATDLSNFKKLEGVIDAVYNPIRTKLVTDAKELGIKAEGGLYMLVAQAAYASQIFLGIKQPIEKINKIYRKIERKKENVVLIGMPASGKTTIAKLIAKEISRACLDTDKLIKEKAQKSIQDIFSEDGESTFRDLESQVIANICSQNNTVIATGGGVVLKDENIKMLKQNGIIVFIDRHYDKLLPSKSRPLASDSEAIKRLYEERYPLYRKAADIVIDANDTPVNTAKKIIGEFFK